MHRCAQQGAPSTCVASCGVPPPPPPNTHAHYPRFYLAVPVQVPLMTAVTDVINAVSTRLANEAVVERGMAFLHSLSKADVNRV